ncbi:unnamed protein product [Mytilus edulis]|uniref:G-protein coupled receptors family 1 profile domain-containing protein n=1 Tax=Mytilus edulis TaxID=6550 RepID=A0A8S3TZR8_MYTED|nr:unnamed protein product [Mytilus edulis]
MSLLIGSVICIEWLENTNLVQIKRLCHPIHFILEEKEQQSDDGDRSNLPNRVTKKYNIKDFKSKRTDRRSNKVTLYATCLTLSALTVDRYHAIVNPVNSMKWRTIRKATAISVAVWTASVLICCPYIIFTNVKVSEYENTTKVFCYTQWPSEDFDKAFTLTVVLTTFVLPFTIMTVCYFFILRVVWRRPSKHNASSKRGHYVNGNDTDNTERKSRSNKRVTKMVAFVFVLFIICWLPIHVIAICLVFDSNFPKTDTNYFIKLLANTLSYANSCVNPFVYAYVHEGLKNTIRQKLSKFYDICSLRVQSQEPNTYIEEEEPSIKENHNFVPRMNLNSI